jgi:hypothetical protein
MPGSKPQALLEGAVAEDDVTRAMDEASGNPGPTRRRGVALGRPLEQRLLNALR